MSVFMDGNNNSGWQHRHWLMTTLTGAELPTAAQLLHTGPNQMEFKR